MAAKPRLLVLTDIGGDPDDQQSLVRLLTYANEFDIVGLIATSAGMPGELKRATTRPDLIRDAIEAYARVLPNLQLHASGYPSAELLFSRVKSGNPERGVRFIGNGHDTEASRHIVQVVDIPDERPVAVCIWGGQTDLAQAIWRVRRDRHEGAFRAFLQNMRIYDVADQDGLAEWIVDLSPRIYYVLAKAPGGRDKREAVFRGMYLGGDLDLTSRQWLNTHVRAGHGPLGAWYPAKTWTDPNPHGALKEGDTPSWFFFLDNGLQDAGQPEWGGWGGRFIRGGRGMYRDTEDTVDGASGPRATVWRWRPHFQNHFQARMDWCVKPYPRANHAPIAVLNGDDSRRITVVDARPGDTVTFSAKGSRDPDGDDLSFLWWVYREAGTCPADLTVANADTAEGSLVIPDFAGRKQIHVILEVTDSGDPPLTSYRRLVIRVLAQF